MKRIILTTAASLSVLLGSISAQTNQYPGAIVKSGVFTESETWTSDNVYRLDGYVVFDTPDGATSTTTLTIEAGTIIVGANGSADANGALFITDDAMIMAQGTANSPIIFTSEFDNVAVPGDTNETQKGLWGGIVILGQAPLNSAGELENPGDPIRDQIEGVVTGGNFPADLFLYGGDDEDHNSGVMRYVSIRHGGVNIGATGGGNELNGLSLGGVGEGTTLEFIEVFANLDDGIEFFGGTVNLKYAVVSFGGDDSYDYDQGWVGYGQFWASFAADDVSQPTDNGGEHDGETDPGPFQGGGTVYNATYIGIGGPTANNGLLIRDNADAEYYNSIFANFDTMITLEADNEADDVTFDNNLVHSHLGTVTVLNDMLVGEDATQEAALEAHIATFTNTLVADLPIVSYSRTQDGGLDPRPVAVEALYGDVTSTEAEDDDFLTAVSYKGAFAPGEGLWIGGWTALATMGYLPAGVEGPEDGSAFELSTRGTVGVAEADYLIAGFQVVDNDTDFVVRGLGPRLIDQGLAAADVADDPVIFIFDQATGAVIASNDDWATGADATDLTDAGLAPPNASEAAVILEDLAPGAYTVQVRAAVGSQEGTAIVQVITVDID